MPLHSDIDVQEEFITVLYWEKPISLHINTQDPSMIKYSALVTLQ
jgi:hypothetical protein